MLALVVVKLKTDKGEVKIEKWAPSIKAAIELVLRAENAERAAVIYARAKRLTIYDIKGIVEETNQGKYFFSRDTMRFFRQRLSDFSVRRWGDDKFYLSAPSFGGNVTERIFNPFTGELTSVEK